MGNSIAGAIESPEVTTQPQSAPTPPTEGEAEPIYENGQLLGYSDDNGNLLSVLPVSSPVQSGDASLIPASYQVPPNNDSDTASQRGQTSDYEIPTDLYPVIHLPDDPAPVLSRDSSTIGSALSSVFQGIQDAAQFMGNELSSGAQAVGQFFSVPSDPTGLTQNPSLLALYTAAVQQGSDFQTANRNGILIDQNAALQRYADLQNQLSKAIQNPTTPDSTRAPLATAGYQLYQGANIAGIAGVTQFPPSVLYAGASSQYFSGGGTVGPRATSIPGSEVLPARTGTYVPIANALQAEEFNASQQLKLATKAAATNKVGELQTSGLEVVPRPGMTSRIVLDKNGNPVTIYGQAERSSSTTPGHPETMNDLANRLAQSGDYESITLQRSVRTATGRVGTSGNIPDVIGIQRNGLVDLFEIQSATDDESVLLQRLIDGRATLPVVNQGRVQVLPPQPPAIE